MALDWDKLINENKAVQKRWQTRNPEWQKSVRDCVSSTDRLDYYKYGDGYKTTTVDPLLGAIAVRELAKKGEVDKDMMRWLSIRTSEVRNDKQPSDINAVKSELTRVWLKMMNECSDTEDRKS